MLSNLVNILSPVEKLVPPLFPVEHLVPMLGPGIAKNVFQVVLVEYHPFHAK